MTTKVALHLNTLTCAVETEHGSEPYVWPIMIGEDGGGIPHLVSPNDEWAGKVLVQEMMAGQSVAIPQGLDVAQFFTDPAAALVVVVIVLTDKDSSPQHGTAAVLEYIEDRALAFVTDHLAECRASSGERNDLGNAFGPGLAVDDAETAALTWGERLATWLSSDGFDDSIGLAFWALSGPAIRNRDITFNLSGHSQEYSLTASLQLSPIVVFCQAERDEAARALALVKSLQNRIGLLQDRLHHATPQQKAAIVDQITHIAGVELPPAEAALAQAEAALKACLDRFGSAHGPLDAPLIG